MNKSIYEEAFEKIDVGFGGWDRAARLDFVKHALKQAQKQEKLLELYRYLNENTISYDLSYDEEDEITSKIDEIEKQIKELEKQIKELENE